MLSEKVLEGVGETAARGHAAYIKPYPGSVSSPQKLITTSNSSFREPNSLFLWPPSAPDGGHVNGAQTYMQMEYSYT